MNEPWLRIELSADDDSPMTVMFEPSGMSYVIGQADRMFADVNRPRSNNIVIESWSGGISIWAPGDVVTRNASGEELDRLN